MQKQLPNEDTAAACGAGHREIRKHVMAPLLSLNVFKYSHFNKNALFTLTNYCYFRSNEYIFKLLFFISYAVTIKRQPTPMKTSWGPQ